MYPLCPMISDINPQDTEKEEQVVAKEDSLEQLIQLLARAKSNTNKFLQLQYWDAPHVRVEHCYWHPHQLERDSVCVYVLQAVSIVDLERALLCL